MSDLPPSTRKTKSATALRSRRAAPAAYRPSTDDEMDSSNSSSYSDQGNSSGYRDNTPPAAQRAFSSIARRPTILAPEHMTEDTSDSFEDTGRSTARRQRSAAQRQQTTGDTGKRRTLMDGAAGTSGPLTSAASSGRHRAVRQREQFDADDDRATSYGRTREQSAARPLSSIPGTLKLPSITQRGKAQQRQASPTPYAEPEPFEEYETADEAWDEDAWQQNAHYADADIANNAANGRELIPAPPLPLGYVTMPSESIPDLAAYHAPTRVKPRARVNTQMLVERARSPWSISRTILGVIVMLVTLCTAVGVMGEPSQGLMQTAFASSAGGVGVDVPSIASKVRPETQGKRPDLYDNYTQFTDWWDADCAAATASEVLTAWSVHNATIGKMIDVMQPDISLSGGLLRITGYQRGVSTFGFRADIRNNLSYNQLLYLTHTLGLPVIVNVRISYGYFHFFSGGHFLVMTDGDSQGLRIVDSSEYYITYLPRDVFYSMFTGITVVIVPAGYDYSLPNS